jgi:hypothetical protein
MHNETIETWEPNGSNEEKSADPFLEPKKMLVKSLQGMHYLAKKWALRSKSKDV